jgi:hypothetical protein
MSFHSKLPLSLIKERFQQGRVSGCRTSEVERNNRIGDDKTKKRIDRGLVSYYWKIFSYQAVGRGLRVQSST